MTGNLYGSIIGDVTVTGNLEGDLCGNVYTDNIFEKTSGNGITINDNIATVGTSRFLGKLFICDVIGAINISTGGYIDLTYDTQNLIDTAYFSHTTGTAPVTINEDGWYRITVNFTSWISAGTSRSDSSARLVVDTGGGFTVVPCSLTMVYNRTVGLGQNSGNIDMILQLNDGDIIKVQAQRDGGTSTVETPPNTNRFLIEKI